MTQHRMWFLKDDSSLFSWGVQGKVRGCLIMWGVRVWVGMSCVHSNLCVIVQINLNINVNILVKLQLLYFNLVYKLMSPNWHCFGDSICIHSFIHSFQNYMSRVKQIKLLILCRKNRANNPKIQWYNNDVQNGLTYLVWLRINTDVYLDYRCTTY